MKNHTNGVHTNFALVRPNRPSFSTQARPEGIHTGVDITLTSRIHNAVNTMRTDEEQKDSSEPTVVLASVSTSRGAAAAQPGTSDELITRSASPDSESGRR